MSWQALTDRYKESGIVLALGAGVSLGSHLPSWIGLLERLAEECLGSGGAAIVKKLRGEGFTLPAIASMIRAKTKTSADFPDRVRKLLYQDFRPYRALQEPTFEREKIYAQLVEDVQQDNATLRAVAALCAKWEPDQRLYVPNAKVQAIVNFNVDAIFRVYMAERYKAARDILVRTIERPSKSRDAQKISTYYMHGYLRFDQRAGNPGREASDKLVLGEEEYFDFFNSPTSVFNYTFLHLLREYPCLFIGLSMQDDNIRRLLHYSRKERLQGYAEESALLDEQDKALALEKAKHRTIRHFAILKHSESSEIDGLHELALRNLGTQVLWLSDFKELPIQIGKMYSSTGDSWSRVY